MKHPTTQGLQPLPWLCLAFILLLLPGLSVAQTITGKVLENGTDKAVEFATVSLHKAPDTSLVTGTITDAQGQFLLEKIPGGDYLLKVDFIGYEAYFSEAFKMEEGDPMRDMGSISLKSGAQQIGEVEVAADRNLMETKIDKRVFNVEKSLLAQGGDGLEVLRNVPSIDVDQDNNISLRGDANVTILIDGRPNAMPASQLLAQIPASAIERVEIITNPSAKYDPEGQSGIINIILKKNLNRGFNGFVNTNYSYGRTGKFNGTAGINYRTPKLNMSANYNRYSGPFWFGGESWRRYTINDTTYIQTSDDDGMYTSNSHYGSLGLDWYVNDKNTIYINGNAVRNNGRGERNLTYENLDADGNVLWTSNRAGVNPNPQGQIQLNGGWSAKFDKPEHTFDLDIDYQDAFNNSHETIREDFFFSDQTVTDPVMQETDIDSRRRQLYIRNDYVRPINDSTTLELGIHSTTRWMDDGFQAWNFDHSQGALLYDSSVANTFVYEQQVWAAYSTFGKQWNKFGVKLGLRAEQTLTEAKLINTGEVFENDYFALFPSAHFSYKFTPTREMQLSYGRRINRPVTDMLNPFYTYDDPYTIQAGNPFLQPEFINVFEMSYLQYFKKFNVNASVYYRNITDMFRRFLSLRPDGVSMVSYENLATGHLTGGELILGYNPKENWRNNLTVNYWRAVIDDPTLDQDLSFSNHGWSANLTSSYQFKKGLSAQVSANYNARMVTLQGIIFPRGGIDIGLRQQLFKKRGSLGVRFSDILGTRQFKFESVDVPGQTFYTTRLWESQTVNVSFMYRFGKMQFGPKQRRRNSNDASDDFNTPDMQ